MIKYFKFLSDSLFQNKSALAFGLILIIAFLLRIWGIKFGLPHIYHTDEWFEVKRALKLGAGVFDFERVSKGGYFYLLFVEYGFYFVFLKLFGILKSTDEFLLSFFRDPSSIWLIGRTTTGIIGTLNVFALYLLGKKAFSQTVGLVAALFLAINLIHVQSSHYITVDVPLTFLLTICFLIMNWKSKYDKFTVIQYGLLGISVAMAVMTKITGAVIILPVLFFHLVNVRSESSKLSFKSYFFDKRLILFFFLCVVVYVSGNPGIIIKLKSILFWLFTFFKPSGNALVTPQFPQINPPASLIKHYVNILFPFNHLVLNILILLGIILAFRKKYSTNHYLLLSFLIPYLFFLLASKSVEHIYPRYVLPLIPILSIYGGIFFDITFERFRSKIYSRAIITVILLVAIFPIIRETIAFDSTLTKVDTRTVAKSWIDENISSDSIIFIEGSLYKASALTVPLKLRPDLFGEVLLDNIELQEKEEFYEILKKALAYEKTYHLVLTYNKNQFSKALNERKCDYIIIRENFKKSFESDYNKSMFPLLYRMMSWSESDEFFLLKVFEYNDKMRGPTILIYRRKQDRS